MKKKFDINQFIQTIILFLDYLKLLLIYYNGLEIIQIN